MQVIQLFTKHWFVIGLGGYAFFGLGLFMMGLNYYYCGTVLQSTFLQANPLLLVGLAMILSADAIKKIEDRLSRLEAGQQGDKRFDASSMTSPTSVDVVGRSGATAIAAKATRNRQPAA